MSAKNVISSGKDLLALLRDLFIFMLALCFLIYPAMLNDRLQKAGFESGDFLGLKWKNSLSSTYSALNDAKALNNTLQLQNDSLVHFINTLKADSMSPHVVQQITDINKWNTKINDSSKKQRSNINNVVAANAALIKTAQEAVNTGSKWGVVFGADLELKGALYEKNTIAPRLHLPEVFVYYRQGYYRSVSILDSRDDADSILAIAKQRRKDAYIVPMSTWCQDEKETGEFKTCPVLK